MNRLNWKNRIILGILFFIPSCESENVDTEILLALAMPRQAETRIIESESQPVEYEPTTEEQTQNIEPEAEPIIDPEPIPKFKSGYIYFLDKNENILWSEKYNKSRIKDYRLLLDIMENDSRCPCQVLAIP